MAAAAWAPQTAHVVTGGSDGEVLLWELGGGPRTPRGAEDEPLSPVRRYTVRSEVAALGWSAAWPRHLAIAFGRSLQVLRL